MKWASAFFTILYFLSPGILIAPFVENPSWHKLFVIEGVLFGFSAIYIVLVYAMGGSVVLVAKHVSLKSLVDGSAVGIMFWLIWWGLSPLLASRIVEGDFLFLFDQPFEYEESGEALVIGFVTICLWLLGGAVYSHLKHKLTDNS